MRNGVPFDVAHDFQDWELTAWSIMFSKFENGNLDFDWDTGRFVERP